MFIIRRFMGVYSLCRHPFGGLVAYRRHSDPGFEDAPGALFRHPLRGFKRICVAISHSWRNADSGSTCAALRAGNQQAISATDVNSDAITTNVNGSVPCTP